MGRYSRAGSDGSSSRQGFENGGLVRSEGCPFLCGESASGGAVSESFSFLPEFYTTG